MRRLLFIDNIRWVLIAVVICHHAAVTYSHVGGWYYTDGPQPPLLTTALFATAETFNQAYFMGLLFLLAGYFVPRAYDAKGFTRFLRDRAIRLGLPTAFFMLVIHPFIVYWLLRNFHNPAIPPLTQAYGRFLSSGKVLSASGPMWFALALLIFCLVYGLLRLATRRLQLTRTYSLPGHKQVIALIALMGLCSFLVRIAQPIGKNILNMQLCYFPQYICLFTVGILAYRDDWLLRLPYAFGMFWCKLALIVGAVTWPPLLIASGALSGHSENLMGGWRGPSAAFSFWEALICAGMCLGLIVFFREHWNRQSPLTHWLSQNSFSAYLFHTPILIAITLALKPFTAPLAAKFLVASAIAVPLTFALSGFIRTRIPGLSRLL